MSVVFSGTVQGSFTTTGTNASNNTTAAGTAFTQAIPTGFDWITVRNITKSGVAGAALGVGLEFWWDRSMPHGSALVKYYSSSGAGNILLQDKILTGGIYPVDTSIRTPGNPVSITQVDGSTPPIVSTADTSGLVAGVSVV